MVCARAALLALLLVAGILSPLRAWAQEPRGPPFDESARGFRFGQIYPDPIDQEAWIPFYLEEELFADGDTVVVTIRIINVLRQLVAIPVAVDHPIGRAMPLLELPFAVSGRKVAYWDGRDTAGRPVRSGTYYCELIVNGQPSIFLKMIVPRRRSGFLPWFMR